jgi:hypothetical protein
MTQHDERPAGEDAALAARLEGDGAAWRAQVPPNDWLNARVLTIPGEQPRTTQRDGTRRQRSQVEWVFEDSVPATDIPAGMMRVPTSGIGGRAAGIGAVVIVGLIAVLLLGSRAVPYWQSAGLGSAQSTATPTPPSLETPTGQQYSPAAQYITSMITARGVDPANQPLEPTSQFTQRMSVFVIVRVKNVPAGQHTLTIRWFLYGQRVQLPSNAVSSAQVTTGTVSVVFTCAYKLAGKGTAKLYWDLPPNASDVKADAWLVRDVAFVVTPVPGPTPTLGPTPTP